MSEPLTPEELKDIQEVGEHMRHVDVAEGLEQLLSREKVLLEQSDLGEGEARQITIHNITILAAAAARIRGQAEREQDALHASER